MKQPIRIALSSATLTFLAGCASPPMAPPDALTDYRAQDLFETTRENARGKDVKSSECVLKKGFGDTAIDKSLEKLFIRSCEYAKFHDYAKNFKAYSDQGTLGLATTSAIGALTDTNSDIVKSLAGLAALTTGLRVYVNPGVQMNTYIKAANATQCMATSVKKLKRIVGNYTAEDLVNKKNNAKQLANALSQIKYNQDLQSSLITYAPGPATIDILTLANSPATDLTSKEQAINFLIDIETLTDENLRTIYGKIVSTLNSQAFNVESATKPITDVTPRGSNPDEALAKTSQQLEDQGLVPATDADETVKAEYIKRASSKNSLDTLRALLTTDEALPYSEIIRINNGYTECMTTFSKN